jgi:hypothetical protein
MASKRFYITFQFTITQAYPKEEIHKIEISRELEYEHWWDPLPQIGSTISIPFIEKGDLGPYLGPNSFDKTPCTVVDIVHELNGHLSYSRTYVVCEVKCSLDYITWTFHCEDLASFTALLDARGWTIHASDQ